MKARIINLIGSIAEGESRVNANGLLNWLEASGYYTSPASIRYHNVFDGGLVAHCWDVYCRLSLMLDDLGIEISPQTKVIAGLLHDVCKAGHYIGQDGAYKINKAHPKGHGALSVDIVKQFIDLTELEEKMIFYHMGLYGCYEFDEKSGEYPLRGGGLANAWYHHPAVKLIYFCDELATLEEKAHGHR